MVKMEIPMTNSRNKFVDVVLTCSNITIGKWTNALNQKVKVVDFSWICKLPISISPLHWKFPIVHWGGVERMLATFSTVGTKSSKIYKNEILPRSRSTRIGKRSWELGSTRSWPINNELGPTRENLEVWSLSCGSSLWQTRQSKPAKIFINWSPQRYSSIGHLKWMW